MTFSLDQRGSRFLLAFSGERISGTDASGRSFTARIDKNPRNIRWVTDTASKRIARESNRHFRIGLAIAADLIPSQRSRNGRSDPSLSIAETKALGSQGQCDQYVCCIDGCCNGTLSFADDIVEGGLTRSLACSVATEATNANCDDYSGCGKCCSLFDDCDCFCDPLFGSDFLCACIRFGYPFDSIQRCG